MSATVIMRALLLARSQVLDLVPADRIRIGELPLATALPAVNITDVSGNEIATVARRSSNSTIRAHVQVTVYGRTYEEQERVLLACKLGAGVHKGIVTAPSGAQYPVDSVLPEGVGPAIPPGESKIYERSRDFMVTFKEANL